MVYDPKDEKTDPLFEPDLGSFTTNSKIHRERVARRHERPRLPRAVSRVLQLALLIFGLVGAMKLLNIEYGDMITEYASEKFNNMVRWWIP